jgi:hypothetical protein
MNRTLFVVLVFCLGLGIRDAKGQSPELNLNSDTTRIHSRSEPNVPSQKNQKHLRRRRELQVAVVCLGIVASALVLFNVRSR